MFGSPYPTPAQITRLLLRDLVRVSLESRINNHGVPATQLIRDITDRSLDSVIATITHPGENEYRLNGAGLKLYTRRHQGHITFHIGGDQAKNYPEFVTEAGHLCELASTLTKQQ